MAEQQDNSEEMKRVRQEVEERDAQLASLQSQAGELKDLQLLLEDWETSSLGKADLPPTHTM